MNTATTSAGTWTVTLNGQTLPCAVRVSGGTVNGSANGMAYHSIAIAAGTVNITPLTDLVVAQIVGSPASWFNAPTFNAFTSQTISSAVDALKSQLGLSVALGTRDPLTSAFSANGTDALDKALDALAGALTTFGKTYADLIAVAQSKDFATFAGFADTFNSAWGALNASSGGASGGSSGSGGGTGSGGSTGGGSGGTATLLVETFMGNASSPISAVTLTNVPRPGSQTDFCAAVNDDPSLRNLQTPGASLTVNQCTFSGNVGTVSLTITVTSPVTFSTSYTVRYTYS